MPIIINRIDAEIDSREYPVIAIPIGVDTSNNEFKKPKNLPCTSFGINFLYNTPKYTLLTPNAIPDRK